MLSKDLFQRVTSRIVSELETGVEPWKKPWKSGRKCANGFVPCNAITGRSYRGANVLITWDAADRCGYPRHLWLTYKQAAENGGTVRKGEKGTQIVFWDRKELEDENTGERRQVMWAKVYTIFNLAQTDGVALWNGFEPEPSDPYDYAAKADCQVGELAKAAGIPIQHGGDRACYVPSKDIILMPPLPAFHKPGDYSATLLHEEIHGTGHEKRLGRDLKSRYGDEAYAAEELIAELGAAFLCAGFGIEPTHFNSHASYIASWLKVLKGDPKAIFHAAGKAQQAADFLMEPFGNKQATREQEAA